MLQSDPGFCNPYGLDEIVATIANSSGSVAFQQTRSFAVMHLRRQAGTKYWTMYLSLREKQNAAHAIESVQRGVKCAKAGDFAGAMKHYEYALHVDPRNVEAHVARGAAYANQGILAKAVIEFETALRMEPREASTSLSGNLRAHENAKLYLAATKSKIEAQAKLKQSSEKSRTATVKPRTELLQSERTISGTDRSVSQISSHVKAILGSSKRKKSSKHKKHKRKRKSLSD